jgi:hypothetical protein
MAFPLLICVEADVGSEGSPDSLVCVLAIGLQAGRSENQGSFPGSCKRFFLLSAVRPIRPRIRWVLTAVSPGLKRSRLEADHLRLVTRSRMPELPLLIRLQGEALSYNTGLHLYL